MMDVCTLCGVGEQDESNAYLTKNNHRPEGYYLAKPEIVDVNRLKSFDAQFY